MNENLKDNLKKIYAALPEELREVIFAPETTDVYDRIMGTYGLSAKQRETLSIQTGLLLMGLRAPQELVPVLTTEMSMPRDKVAAIAQEINRDIFNPVKDVLMQVHGVVESLPAALGIPDAAKIPSVAAAPYVAPAPRPVEKLNIPFSVSSALGNAPVAPKPEMKSEVHPAAMGNIFESKLGGAFRAKSEVVSVAGTPGEAGHVRVPHKPTQVIPPPPTPDLPQAKIPDPYREMPH